jgi:2-dehydro-3-deoxyphosphooctonate aldolase (KDO 8-P synthase)
MIFDSNKLLLIAGPCSLENERICRTVAEKLIEIGRAHPELRLVFKGSFDKANRTSLAGERGTGLDAGLKLLALVKRDYGLPVLTDVHETQQVPSIAAVCDVVQIPAFLCRQTDLLLAAAASGRVVNVKKGQNLVVDMRSFALMKQNGFPTVFDATHSVQLPGAAGGKSGGQREFVPPLARAALAAGADGLFIEAHPKPEQAISDGPSQIPLAEMPALIAGCLAIWKAVRPPSLHDKELPTSPLLRKSDEGQARLRRTGRRAGGQDQPMRQTGAPPERAPT